MNFLAVLVEEIKINLDDHIKHVIVGIIKLILKRLLIKCIIMEAPKYSHSQEMA